MIAAIAIGLCAGVIGGLLGLGGGVLFVPGLVIVLGLGQHQAEATSLLAIVPVAIVGTIRQDRYENVRRKDAALMGLLSIAGVAAGVVLANALSGSVLRVSFALLLLLVAGQLIRKSLREQSDPDPREHDPSDDASHGNRPIRPDSA
ncbi:MAG TPA: sulfite exporter TauE/SafE family protein [Solirubrobacteraceae bacterium]